MYTAIRFWKLMGYNFAYNKYKPLLFYFVSCVFSCTRQLWISRKKNSEEISITYSHQLPFTLALNCSQ